MNIAEIGMELSDLVNEPFDRTEFVFRFLEVFHAPKASITKLRTGTQNKADLVGDVLWQRKLYYRTAEAGQSALTVDALKARKPAATNKPRFILATDGKEVSALDTKSDETIHCDFDKLNDNFGFFLPLAGIDKYEAVEENPADITAAGRLAKFYDEILRCNPDWRSPAHRHALNQFLTRILFCLFAEDTGSFDKDLFVKTITEFGGEDGGELQALLAQLFDVMNVPDADRVGIPAHIRTFPYVNGGLFADHAEVPAFSKRAKRILLEAAALNWAEINPDIFGSMIQAVVDPDMRGDLGMHYTSVPNIMKVLQPLFLMSLEEEFEAAGTDERKLNKLLQRISNIRVFDPACGSGNFLIIAYRELRKVEMRVFERLKQAAKQFQIPFSGVKLSNFYGIELADFAAETAKLSLWIAEYQMNQQFMDMFGKSPPNFPLQDGGRIVCGNALSLDWNSLCTPHASGTDGEEIYIVGNPPYQGSKWQSDEQKRDMDRVFGEFSDNYRNLDYVAAWYFKAAQFSEKRVAQAAFVATNSICQGEQVALLWPLIFSRKLEIGFAHQSFMWKNLAANNAAVSCVIVGIRRVSNAPKTLFDGVVARQVRQIGPYLIQMPNIIVRKSSTALNRLPQMNYGNMTVDGGSLILSPEEKTNLLSSNPEAEPLLRRLYGAQELVKGIERYCLWISDAQLPLARSIPEVLRRIEACRKMRLESKREATQLLAQWPHRFGFISVEHQEHAIIAPRLTTTNRPYIQVGILKDNEVANDQVYSLGDAPMYVFSILSSSLHIAWIKAVCGYFKSDYRYSNTLGYNTFPLPTLTENDKGVLEEHAWRIIAAREAHQGKTLAWLYDPTTMPSNLLDEHRALDVAFEKVYLGRPFKNDTERLEHLFSLYAKMTAEPAREAVNA